MSLNISRYGSILERLMYKDKCTIHRVKKEIKGPWDDKTKREPVEGLVDIPCKISYSRADAPMSTDGMINKSDRNVTLFIPIRYDIVEGDWIVATRTHPDGRIDIVKGICNLPDVFDTQQQVIIKESEDA